MNPGTENLPVSAKSGIHKLLWDNLPVGIVVIDEDRVVYANNKTYEILQISPEYLESKEQHSVFDFISVESNDKFSTLFRDLKKPGAENIQTDWNVRTRGNEERILQLNASPLDFAGRKCVQVVMIDVTSIRKNEERTRDIIQNIDEVVYLIRVNGGKREVEFISENVFPLIGITAEQYRNNTSILKDKVHPDDLPLVIETSRRLHQEKKAQVQTYRFLHSTTSQYVWLEERVYPRMNNEGELTAILGVTRDVTQRTRAEKEIQQSEQKFRMMANNARDVIYKYVFHPTPKYDYISPSIENLSGYTPEEFYKDPFLGYKIIHPDDFKQVERSYATIQEGRTFSRTMSDAIILRWVRKDGKAVWTETRNHPIYDEHGKIVAMEGISRDITEAKEAEDKLKEAEEKFRQLSSNAPVGIFLCDAEGSPYYTNEKFRELLRLEKEVINRENWIQAICPADREPVAGKMKESISNGIDCITEFRIGNNAGEERWLRLSGKAIRSGKRTSGWVGTLEDISESKSVERITRESERRYRELFENSVAGVFRTTVEGQMLDCNRAYQKIFGFTAEEIRTKGVSAFYFDPKDRDDYIRQLRENNTVSNLQLRLRRKGGELVQTLVNAMLTRDPVTNEEVIEGTVLDITGYIKASEALQESERALSTLMSNLPGMAYRCLYDDNWTMLFVSQGCRELTGFEAEEIIGNKGRTFASIVHPEDNGVGTLQIRQAVRDKSSFEIEYRIIQRDGEIRWVWEKGEAVYSPKGEVLFLEGFITDVTERKLFELAQEDSRRMYKNLIESSPEGIFVHDLHGTILFTNQRALSLMGARSSDEFVGRSVLSFSIDEDAPLIRKRRASLLRGEDHGYLESRVKNHKGDTIRIETKPILIDFQGEKAALVFVRDPEYYRQLEKETLRAQFAEETNRRLQEEISERKNTERMLRETQKYTRLLIDSSLDMICASDRDGRLTEFNAAAQRIFGYNQEEVLGKHVGMLYADPEERNKITEGHLYQLGTFSGEVSNRKKNGEVFQAYLSASVLKNDKGEVIGAMGVSRDITEIKQQENNIRQSLREKEVLLKEVHHRVKNNLQVITSILNLQSSYVKDKNTLMMLKESQDRIKSMAFIHESLYQTKDFSNVNFSEYVVNLSKNLMRSYDLSGRKVQFESQVENVHLNLDQSIPCGLIINELVSNALKYAFRKKKKGIITLKIREKEGKVIIVLADDGDGMPKEFNYRKTDSLGLQLVVTLAEQLNGTIKLERKNGTKFTITFPKMIKKQV